MDTPPVVLDYSPPPAPRWRAYVVRGVLVMLAALLVYAAWWATHSILDAWLRYRYVNDYQQAYAALRTYSFPPGTVVMDPAAGPLEWMKPYQTADGSGTVLSLVTPVDPTLEQNLRRMMFFEAPAPYVFASERQVGNIPAMVTATLQHLNMKDSTHLYVHQQKMVWGVFPMYRHVREWDLSVDLHFMPADRRTLPVILAGQRDASPACWTLPLTLNGRPEWVRFDHSKLPAIVTSSFGQLVPDGSGYRLNY